jgi:hypothetical protein
MKCVKYLFSFLFVLLFLLQETIYVFAACENPECGSGYGNCEDWGDDYRCVAKCCVPPDDGSGGTPVPGDPCDATKPVISRVLWNYPLDTKVTTFWWNGTGGTHHTISASRTYTDILSHCLFGTNCVFVDDNAVSPYTVNESLFNTATGTVYIFGVRNYADDCSRLDTEVTISSCSVSPSSITINEGATAELTANVENSQYIAKVSFSSEDTLVATVSPSNDLAYSFSTTVTGKQVTGNQTTRIKVDVWIEQVDGQSDKIACTKYVNVTINDITATDEPWWQVIDGDVTTNQGIASDVPTSNVFIDDGDGGYPGVPVYGTSMDVGDGSTSSTDWKANTATIQPRTFDYSYFEALIPDDVVFGDIDNLSDGVGTTKYYGYEWYKVEGDYNTPTSPSLPYLNLWGRKVILFVSGDLNINNEIFVTNGIGFFGTFVGGSINVDGGITRAGLPSIEGIYLTDEDFSTGVGTSKLWVRGSITALGGFNIQRNLADDSTPAEIFEFAPDQILLFPKVLSFKRTKWAEVAP